MRRNFGERLRRELIGLVVKLVFIGLALWISLYVLPDIITDMFRSALRQRP